LANETASTSWNGSTNPHLEGMEVVREGDKSGYGMVIRFTLLGGREVSAIALPHQFPTRTGPTWAYLVDCEGLTLVDAGPRGALNALEDGLKVLGRKLVDLKRVIITHGHQDHDGNVYDLVKASGAELWAHELYFHFLPYEYARTGLDKESALHRSIFEVRRREEESFRSRAVPSDDSPWRDHYSGYIAGHRNILEEKLPIHAISDGEELGDLRFLYTPGHAVDEICITMNGAMFTGDHILPQITPHPTIKRTYPEAMLGLIIAPEHQEAGEHYGLARYLKSLGKALSLDYHTTLFPAHRLFNHGRFNIRNLQRGREIVRHHVRRLEQVMEVMGEGADTPVKVTEELFPPRKLTGGGFFAAVSEVVSHLELLADTGDIQVSQDGQIKRNGTDIFHSEINAMITRG
jgi:glyoxylase-like metal-dependent hydrolase (beta-lactamase superfamily II)